MDQQASQPNAPERRSLASSRSSQGGDLEAKVEQKFEHVQELIRNLELSINRSWENDRLWLKKIVAPEDPCFITLLRLLVEPKYAAFTALRCVVLRAVQMMLRIAVSMAPVEPGAEPSSDMGMEVLHSVAGDTLASEALQQTLEMAANYEEPLLAFNALIVLAELGPQAIEPDLVCRLLDLFVELPDRAGELVEAALRAHSGGGELRSTLLEEAVSHQGGKLLGEVLLQVINRCDYARRLRAVKLLTGCLNMPAGDSFLYTNDARLLVEILLRELPNHAGEPAAFACYADLLKALTAKSEAVRSHRREDVHQLLQDLKEDERNPLMVRAKCAEVLVAPRAAAAAAEDDNSDTLVGGSEGLAA